MKTSVILAAAGSSVRMGGRNKQLIELSGMPILEHSLRTFCEIEDVCEIILVVSAPTHDTAQALANIYRAQKPIIVTLGGQTRQASVLCGLACCSAASQLIAIHDAARPFVSRALILDVLQQARLHGAAAPGVAVKDTIKLVQDGYIADTPARETLVAIQTPQVFERALYCRAIEHAQAHGLDFTDDCQLVESLGVPVKVVAGEYSNLKITTPEDLPTDNRLSKKEQAMRIGHGYDVHKFAPARKLILGGVEIPYEQGLLGHSDADVLTHSVMDAMLGALCLGDIGKLFPDTDAAYQGADSMVLLAHVMQVCKQAGYRVANLDATVVAQAPKLAGHIDAMRARLAHVLDTPIACISVKATTEEGLGFTGRKEGIAAHCVCLLQPI